MFICCECDSPFESEYVPTLDWRSGRPICEACDGYRKAWPSRLVFPDPSVRMAEVDNNERFDA